MPGTAAPSSSDHASLLIVFSCQKNIAIYSPIKIDIHLMKML